MAPVAFNNVKWMTYLIFVSTNAIILPAVYFLYPETGLRCLEEVDYIFHTANSTRRPWLDVVKLANDEPLWYGRDTESDYDYEASEWHQRHVRFSDEVKDSQGETTTLQASSDEGMEKLTSNGSSSEDDQPRYPSDNSSPQVSRPESRNGRPTSRSAGRGA